MRRLGCWSKVARVKDTSDKGSFLAVLLLALVIAMPGISWAQNQAAVTQQAMLVVDASGSMRGRVEGITKMTLVKRAIKDFSHLWPDDIEVGMVLYGHRRKKDCSDIEVVARPEDGLGMADLAERLQATAAVGNTPLTDALLAAAEAMEGRAGLNSIVLISDGKENCDKNPCAVAQALKTKNIDFTAYVIGLDIEEKEDRAQLQCVARETGGLYWDAAVPEDLTTALEDVEQNVEDGGPQGLLAIEPLAYSCGGEEVLVSTGYYGFVDAVRVLDAGRIQPRDEAARDANAVVGRPDYAGVTYADGSFYSLGCQGEIELSFQDNLLMDAPGADLCIVEVGQDTEPVLVTGYIDGAWLPLGRVGEGTATLDLAQVLPGDLLQTPIERIRLKDLGSCEGAFPGADLDAVIGLNGRARRQ